METELPAEAAGGREAPVPAEAVSEELLEGLRLLDNSQSLIRVIFLGLALQYRSLNLQRCQLLAQEEGGNPQAMRVGASLITLCALFGFQSQAEEIACQSARAGVCPDLMDVKLGAVVILVSLIRLIRLLRPQAQDASGFERLQELSEEAESDL